MSKIICVLAFALPGQAIQAQKSDGIGDDEIKSLIKFATTQAKYAASQAIHAASQVKLAREQFKAAQAQVKVADQQKNFANMVLAYVQSFAAKVMELFVLANENINAWFKTFFDMFLDYFAIFPGLQNFVVSVFVISLATAGVNRKLKKHKKRNFATRKNCKII